MQFALLYYYDPAVAGPTKEELLDWLAFDGAVRKAGAFVHEAGFHSVSRARTVRVRDGEPASEQGGATGAPVLAGYYVVDVDSIEAAEGWAAKIPTARYGAVEVRPIVQYDA
jgi:hypothetical protein